MSIPVKTVSFVALAFAIVALSNAAFAQDSGNAPAVESPASVVAQLESDTRFTALESDGQGCHKAVYGKRDKSYHLYRDSYLVAETRWLYCTGKIDRLPSWVR